MNNIETLRKLYIDDLSAIIDYGGQDRPRVRHPGKWANLQSQIQLNEGCSPIKLPHDGKKVWVWSDPHFSHKNIIEFSNRPYIGTSDMNKHLIENFNDCVGPDDISIWVGDVGFKGTSFINELLDQCNGYKILVIGNHDFNGKKLRNLKFDETHLLYTFSNSDVDLVFTHYPMRNIALPWVNIHGHLHAYPNPHTGNILHYNVCCELHNYRPVELSELIKIAKMRLIASEI